MKRCRLRGLAAIRFGVRRLLNGLIHEHRTTGSIGPCRIKWELLPGSDLSNCILVSNLLRSDPGFWECVPVDYGVPYEAKVTTVHVAMNAVEVVADDGSVAER
jgi:hypothetical protein